MTSVNNITARYLDHLDSLRKRHAYKLNSRVGRKYKSEYLFLALHRALEEARTREGP